MSANPVSKLPPAIVLMGPTASGKSGVGLALAEKIGCEIISVDSGAVYRHMNIGTAKPPAEALARVPHHLIDVVEPSERYSAARFRADALALMDAMRARGRIPLLAGGTMLYFKALRQGLSDVPEADADLRREIDARAARLGWPALHRELERLDPVTAARLPRNDAQRIQRALEVCYATGQPMSALLDKESAGELPYRLIEIALLPSIRAELHTRIARRFDAMLQNGLVDEVVWLRGRYCLHAGMPSMRCVGYRQVWQHLEGEIDSGALREKGIAATRQLAKRQLTWLRARPQVKTFDCLAPDLANQVFDYAAQAVEI